VKKIIKDSLAKNPLVIALVLVSIICIIFAVTALGLTSSLKAERAKVASLDKEILALQRDFDIMMNEQANIIGDLRSSLESAKEEARPGSEAE